MTDYEKKWLWIFIGVEVATYLLARLLQLLLGYLPTPSNEDVASITDLLKDLLLPGLLIFSSLFVAYQYRKHRDGEV